MTVYSSPDNSDQFQVMLISQEVNIRLFIYCEIGSIYTYTCLTLELSSAAWQSTVMEFTNFIKQLRNDCTCAEQQWDIRGEMRTALPHPSNTLSLWDHELKTRAWYKIFLYTFREFYENRCKRILCNLFFCTDVILKY